MRRVVLGVAVTVSVVAALVRSGTVKVLDGARHRTVTVGAGQSYLARAHR